MGKSIRLMSWNIENLFLYADLYKGEDLRSISEKTWQDFSSSQVRNKELKKVLECQKIIKSVNADIIMLNEVGESDSLNFFNKHFLNNAYKGYLIEGNSRRGIDVGYLVKKDLDLNFLHLSHKDRAIPLSYENDHSDQKYYLSRDLSELRIFKDNTLKLVILLVHLKSQLDPDGIDPKGLTRRHAEVQCVLEIYKNIKKESIAIPIILAGDFNGHAGGNNTASEFLNIYNQTDLRDVLDIKGVSSEKQITQIQILSNKVNYLRLDYIFACKEAAKLLNKDSSFVYRFENDLGRNLALPQNSKEKQDLPSDHYPVVTEFII